jgi:hypothetical protein
MTFYYASTNKWTSTPQPNEKTIALNLGSILQLRAIGELYNYQMDTIKPSTKI